MEKEVKQFKINYSLYWEGMVEISKMREDLDAIEKLGATHVSIETYTSYDCASLEIDPISERIETDKEYEARIKIQKYKEGRAKREELAELERLKLKYGDL